MRTIEISEYAADNLIEVMAEASHMLKDNQLLANPISFRCTWAELAELGKELQLAIEKSKK